MKDTNYQIIKLLHKLYAIYYKLLSITYLKVNILYNDK